MEGAVQPQEGEQSSPPNPPPVVIRGLERLLNEVHPFTVMDGKSLAVLSRMVDRPLWLVCSQLVESVSVADTRGCSANEALAILKTLVGGTVAYDGTHEPEGRKLAESSQELTLMTMGEWERWCSITTNMTTEQQQQQPPPKRWCSTTANKTTKKQQPPPTNNFQSIIPTKAWRSVVAVLEIILSEVLEYSGNELLNRRKYVMRVDDIAKGMRGDTDLWDVMVKVCKESDIDMDLDSSGLFALPDIPTQIRMAEEIVSRRGEPSAFRGNDSSADTLVPWLKEMLEDKLESRRGEGSDECPVEVFSVPAVPTTEASSSPENDGVIDAQGLVKTTFGPTTSSSTDRTAPLWEYLIEVPERFVRALTNREPVAQRSSGQPGEESSAADVVDLRQGWEKNLWAWAMTQEDEENTELDPRYEEHRRLTGAAQALVRCSANQTLYLYAKIMGNPEECKYEDGVVVVTDDCMFVGWKATGIIWT